MQQIRLKRMNHPDLVFSGELVASIDDQRMTANIPTRLQLSLYKTAVGRFILAVVLHHLPSSEPKIFHGALAFESLASIRDFLAGSDGRDLSDPVGVLLEQTGHAPQSAGKERARIRQRSAHV
jgi:hypothetical protein